MNIPALTAVSSLLFDSQFGCRKDLCVTREEVKTWLDQVSDFSDRYLYLESPIKGEWENHNKYHIPPAFSVVSAVFSPCIPV